MCRTLWLFRSHSAKQHFRRSGTLCFSRFMFCFSFRKDNLKYKEKDHHGHAACNDCHKDIIDSRSHICRRNGHPQVVEGIADQGYHNPGNEIPHSLIGHIAVALKGNVPLQWKIDALCHKGAYLITDKIPQTAADQHGSCIVSARLLHRHTGHYIPAGSM